MTAFCSNRRKALMVLFAQNDALNNLVFLDVRNFIRVHECFSSFLVERSDSILLELLQQGVATPRCSKLEQNAVTSLDKKISEALRYADEMVDVKKDERIEGIVCAKKTIGAIDRVKTAAGRKALARSKVAVPF